MTRKTTILLASYALAAIAALGIYSFAAHRSLEAYRLSSKYSSMLSFEETVDAVERMSKTLAISPYATDGSMCGKICAQVYADAMAAEAALSTLPFATQELEDISAYLNQAGDYACSLCSSAAQDGFTAENVEKLTELSGIASDLSDSLRQLQGSVYEGSVLLDSRERERVNVGLDNSVGMVSEEFARFESEFPHRSRLSYDGKYSDAGDKTASKGLSDAEKLAVAARFAGVSPAEMKLRYEYQGAQGQKCYSVGDMIICVDGGGVESMSRSRLVSESSMDMDKAEKLAAAFLEKQGFKGFTAVSKAQQGAVGHFEYCRSVDGVVYPDSRLGVSVALDDGSVCAFSRKDWPEKPEKAEWSVSAEQAKTKLPNSLSMEACEKVVIKTEGGSPKACYRFRCTNAAGEPVSIYIDAATGRQSRIVLDEI